MKRWLICGLAALALTGCQTARTPSDPFLRRTVPPPGTGACLTPGTYYNPNDLAPMSPSAPPTVSTLPPGGAPPTYASPPAGAPMYGSPPANYGSQPASGSPPATYAPSGQAPPAGSLPATPSPNGPSYAPPNGYNWPQSSAPPANSQPNLVRASASAPVTISPPQSVTVASAPANSANASNSANGSSAANLSTASPTSAAGDSTASDGSSTGFVPKWNSAPRATRASFNQPASGGSPNPNSGASASVGTPPPIDATGGAGGQSLEITDLPEATGASTLRAYGPPRSRLVIKRAEPSDASGGA